MLVLLPAYGMVSFPLTDVVPQASTVLIYSNVVVVLIMFLMGEIRFDGGILYGVTSYVAANLAFWLPVAHLVDVRLEKARRRRARRRRAGRGR